MPDVVAKLAADTVLFASTPGGPHVLMIERQYPPQAGCWALPGGHVDEGETFQQAAARELAEETGAAVPVDELVFAGLYDDPGRDARGRYITVAYTATLDRLADIVAGDDARIARWRPVTTVLSAGQVAFDHERIIRDALEVAGLMPATTAAGSRPLAEGECAHDQAAAVAILAYPDGHLGTYGLCAACAQCTAHDCTDLGTILVSEYEEPWCAAHAVTFGAPAPSEPEIVPIGSDRYRELTAGEVSG